MAVSQSERRRHYRHAVSYAADLLEPPSRESGVDLLDLSLGGAGIRTAKELALGEVYWLRVWLGRRVWSAPARVRWARPAGVRFAYGLELEGLSAASSRALARALKPSRSAELERFLPLAAGLVALYVGGDLLASRPDLRIPVLLALPYLVLALAGLLLVRRLLR